MNIKIIFTTLCIIGIGTGSLLFAKQQKTEIQSVQDSAYQEKIKLGRYLFYDGDLSKDGSMSCGTCHRQKHAFTDGNKTHPGVNNDEGIFNVPTLGNIGEFNHLTWENQNVRTLEQHALIPITGTIPVEMGMNQQEKEIERRIATNPCYVELFNKAFPDALGDNKDRVTIDHIIQAISAFERTLITNHSIWDTKKGFTFEMQKGEKIFFGKGQCANCHTPPLFTDQKFYKINDYIKTEIRTPTLRNIELTAPYFHDGSITTIQNAIINHSQGKTNVPKLSQQELNELIAFLNSLTDQNFITNPNFSLPPDVCEKNKR